MDAAAQTELGVGYELTLSRIFQASRGIIFAAWTEPQQVARWWGPNGFTNPVCELDTRPGGRIRVAMRAPDGTVYPMSGTFREVVPEECLVFTSTAFADALEVPGLEYLNSVAFRDVVGGVEVALEVLVLTAERHTLEALRGMEAGWRQSFERLAQLLRGLPSD